jgi:hypothetical protein
MTPEQRSIVAEKKQSAASPTRKPAENRPANQRRTRPGSYGESDQQVSDEPDQQLSGESDQRVSSEPRPATQPRTRPASQRRTRPASQRRTDQRLSREPTSEPAENPTSDVNDRTSPREKKERPHPPKPADGQVHPTARSLSPLHSKSQCKSVPGSPRSHAFVPFWERHSSTSTPRFPASENSDQWHKIFDRPTAKIATISGPGFEPRLNRNCVEECDREISAPGDLLHTH